MEEMCLSGLGSDYMKKAFLFTIMGITAAVFISCSPLDRRLKDQGEGEKTVTAPTYNMTGAYLAGRVAHIRKDFGKAADYYRVILDSHPDNLDMVGQLYLLLASQGRIDEAAVYAQKAIDNKKETLFAYMIVATKKMHDGDFKASIENMNKIDDPLYKSFITPMFNAWGYAGLGDKKRALAALEKLKEEESFVPVYNQQIALLYDYMGENRSASQAYENILNDKTAELSVRMLDIIANFYVRSGQKDKAVNMVNATSNVQALDPLMVFLQDKVNKAEGKNTKPILSLPRVGAAEALFAVVSSFRYAEAIDVAHMYTALTIYLNPEYSTAKILMADILENREVYAEANKIYDSIDRSDIGYYPAQIKKARNLVKMGDAKAAEILLERLSENYNEAQIYIELGDVLRVNEEYSKAVKAYDKAIELTNDKSTLWVLYYAKGVALERSGKWQEAEKVLFKAYKLKKHYLVLNYIGYTWMLNRHNPIKALEFIVEAYNQAPNDASVNDSLGFALYNLGYYEEALPYLENAAEMYPSSAVISSHLGDAYWYAKRFNEARFQWQHALSLKDDSGELDVKATRQKIKQGISEPQLVSNKEKAAKIIKKIKMKK